MLATAAGFARGDSGLAVLAQLVIVVLAGVSLAWRRREPRGVLAIQIAAVLLEGAAGVFQDAGIGIVVACYTVASISSRRTTVVAGALAASALGVSRLAHGGVTPGVLVSATLTVAAACTLGLYVGTRRAYVEQLSERGRARSSGSSEELAAQVASDERARIARELHDVIAHHVSLMVVQGAGVLRRRVDATDATAPCSTRSRRRAARRSAEMRRLLGVLRPDATPASTHAAAGPGRDRRPGGAGAARRTAR